MTQFQQSPSPQPTSFNRGMTLEEYMNSMALNSNNNEPELEDEKQQNLLESSHLAQSQFRQPKKLHYFLEEVDEESLNQSLDDRTAEFPKDDLKDQLTKETFREVHELESRRFSKKTKEDKMRNTAYFTNSSVERTNFRVKHVSNSPAKKKTENSRFNAALTLYGQKFGFSKEKEDKKINELMTFYGKIPKNTEPSKESHKRQSKRQVKTKGGLELNELIECENKIKNNFSQKIYMKDLRIEGIKDRLMERKNKFC